MTRRAPRSTDQEHDRATLREVAAIVTVALAPLARLPRLQLTVFPLAVHPGDAETKVTPAGSVSVSVTPLAGDGPWLLTVTV